MAGGKGTRISGIASDIPKPMIPVVGKPILEYQIAALVRSGMRDILLVTGHLGYIIQDYFKDGSAFDTHISYFHETEALGTAGALFEIEKELSDSFLLINGDLVFDIDFSRLFAFHAENQSLATLVSHPNSHPYDSALLETDSDERIIRWINKEEPRAFYKNRVSSGVYLLDREIIALSKKSISAKKVDLDRDVLKPAISTNRLFAYNTPEYIKDMGTPDRFYQVEEDIAKGRVAARNLSHRQRAIFLDRDGTINQSKGFITRHEDFKLLDGVDKAIRQINKSGLLAIVITNQPVIARGECSLEELDLIHRKMETELGNTGVYIDDLYYCPHHPDRGFAGERLEYKIDCECRKPKPGMLLRAAEKYNIDLSASWMIGDDMRDIHAGKAAGCKTALIVDSAKRDIPANEAPDLYCSSLENFMDMYLK